MRSDIWEAWLRSQDSIFRAQNKKILLLVDNAPSHTLPQLSNSNESIMDTSEEDIGSVSNNEISESPFTTRSFILPNQIQNRTFIELTHITIQYLPPNTTAHIQPMDAGVIKSFKAKYKHQYCRYLLKQFEKNNDIVK